MSWDLNEALGKDKARKDANEFRGLDGSEIVDGSAQRHAAIALVSIARSLAVIADYITEPLLHIESTGIGHGEIEAAVVEATREAVSELSTILAKETPAGAGKGA